MLRPLWPINTGMMGSAEDLYSVLLEADSSDFSLQTLMTKLYLRKLTRATYGLGIDHQNHIFQNIRGDMNGKLIFINMF